MFLAIQSLLRLLQISSILSALEEAIRNYPHRTWSIVELLLRYQNWIGENDMLWLHTI